MVYIHQEKKKGHELKSLRIRLLLGRDKRIIQIPSDKPPQVFVGLKWIGIENGEEVLIINKQPGLFDEGIIIMGDGA